MIVSEFAFMMFISVVTVGLAVGWGGVEMVRFGRAWREPKGLVRQDRLFGSLIGMCISLIGMIGLIIYWWGRAK